ncbi:MAG: hypothetical protein SOZ59_14890 [Candidatus Limivivens sp.]|nr:hypothetical protein [Candidatus Limivivens sp.]
MTKEIQELLEQSEMILVGIGDECSQGKHSQQELEEFYRELAKLLGEKPYFVVTLNTDDRIWDSPLKKEQIVAPCGSDRTGNVVTNDQYDESWYLPQWEIYTKWVQNTLHRRLAVLELGVGFQYPGVVRWPFEKTVYFNQKASLIRVHSKLAQVPPELTERSKTIDENPINFLKKTE